MEFRFLAPPSPRSPSWVASSDPRFSFSGGDTTTHSLLPLTGGNLLDISHAGSFKSTQFRGMGCVVLCVSPICSDLHSAALDGAVGVGGLTPERVRLTF